MNTILSGYSASINLTLNSVQRQAIPSLDHNQQWCPKQNAGSSSLLYTHHFIQYFTKEGQ